MLAILRKELKMYYSSLFSYIYYMIFFLVAGVIFSNKCLEYYSTEFGYSVLRYCVCVVIFMVPLCTMRSFSQERKLKTDQMLFTAPVSTISILAGKYIATAIYVLLPVILSLFYPLFISGYGQVNGDFLFSAYLGSILLIFVALGIGMFLSTLTTNYILAAMLTYVVYIVIMLGRVLEKIVDANGMAYEVLHELSVYNKFYDMISGIVRSGDICYFLVLILLFFVLTWISLLNHRVNWKQTVVTASVAVVIAFLGSLIGFETTKVYDFTPEKLLTLSEQTKDSIKSIEDETYIYYVGSKSQANATYVELLSAYQKLNDNLKVEYIPLSDATFRDAYFSDMPQVNEASMVVATDNRYIILDSDDYITVSQTGKYSYERLLEIEDQLTSAILYTNAENIKKIARIVGHGETVLGSGYLNTLKRSGYEFDIVDLSEESKDISSTFYKDYSAIFICAPDEDYSQDDIEMLQYFLKAGGTLLVSIDPLNEDLDNLYAFLKKYGLDIQSGVVVDPQEGYYILDIQYYLSPTLEDTDYTREVKKKNLGIATYTSKGIALYGEGNGYSVTDLLLTSDSSFSKVDNFNNMTTKGENDINGPFSVASIASNPEEGKIFLMTSDVFFNETANEETGNANSRFFVEMIKSVTGDQDVVWIPGKDVNSQSAHYKSKMIAKAKIIAMVVVPAVILIIGIVILVLRMKNVIWKLKEKGNKKDES